MTAIPETEPTDFTLTIAGAAVVAPATYPVVNPIDESVVAYAPSCSDEQLDDAVRAARDALPTWSATPSPNAARPCWRSPTPSRPASSRWPGC